MSEKIKLPKQWKHWCTSSGLKPHASKQNSWRRKTWSWFSLQGQGRYWRINCYGEFQCGDNYENFDRWALCKIYSVKSIPKTQKQFKEALASLKMQQIMDGN